MRETDTLHGADNQALVVELERRSAALPESLKARLSAALAKKTRPQVKKTLSAAAENAILKAYYRQYNRLPQDIKKRCDWETIFARLLANGGRKLKKAEAMQGGGELVGIDAKGKAMLRDRGVEPVMYGFTVKNKLIQIYNRNPKQMKEVEEWADYSEICGRVQADGYELFADDGREDLDDEEDLGVEMKQVEAYTKVPFVASKDRKEYRASWLKLGDSSSPLAPLVVFDPDESGRKVFVLSDFFEKRDDRFGVIRLLRV